MRTRTDFGPMLDAFAAWLEGSAEFDALPTEVQKAIDEMVAEDEEAEELAKGQPTMSDVHQGQAYTPKKKRKPAPPMELLHKANEEQRFTLGPWYIPDKEDAHSEWTDANELQKALWDYVKSGDRNIRLQHNTDVVAGEWVEAMSFPVPVTLGMTKATGDTKEVTYPAGTVFLGVKWNDWAWDLVKQNKITGFSIGGSAARIDMSLPNATETLLDSARSTARKFVTEEPASTPAPTLKDAMRAFLNGEEVPAELAAEVDPMVKYNGVSYRVVPLAKRFGAGVVNVAGLYGDDDSVAVVRTDGERFWATGSGVLPKLDYAKAQIVLAEVAKAAQRFGSRSAAGRYAANVRWARHVEKPEVQHGIMSAELGRKGGGRGPIPEPTTAEGIAVGAHYDSLRTHCDLDGLAADIKAAGGDPLSPKAVDFVSYGMLRKRLSPERAALHDKIIDEHLKNPDGSAKTPPDGQPEYMFMGGGPAAGKSAMLKTGNGPEWAGLQGTAQSADKHSVVINADGIKESLPPYPRMLAGKGGRSGQMAGASLVHEESSILSKEVNARALAGGFNVVLDGTGDNSAKSMTNKIDAARAAKGANGQNYKVTGLYATVPTATAVERAQNRGLPKGTKYKNADGYEGTGEGRYVARGIVIKTHKGVSLVFPEIADKFDSVKLLDTSGRPPKLIASGSRGKRLKVADKAAYDAFLGKATEVIE